MAEVSRSARLPRAPSVSSERLTVKESQRHTRSEDCLRAAVDWLWETDWQLNYTYLSDGLVRILEQPLEPLVGRHVAALGLLDGAWRSLISVLEQRRPFRDRILNLTSKVPGKTLRVALSGIPVFDSGTGSFSGYRGTGRVVPQAAEGASLEALDQALRDASQLADLWHWRCDESLRLIALCDNYAEVSGRARRESLGSDFASLWQLGRGPTAAILHRKPFRDAPVHWVHEATGGQRRYLIGGRPVFAEDGRFIGYRGVGRDVTELLRSEESAQVARASAEQASRAKSDFLANMSHELRTSLNAIIGFSDAMRSGLLGAGDSDHYQAYARDIHDSGRHLLDLVNDMLDLSRIEAGEESLTCRTVDIANLIESCCRMMGPEVEKRGLVLRAAVGEEARLIRVDPPKMRQILLNLLGNAVKFTPVGGEVSVTFRIADDRKAEFEVRDSGVGIKASEIPKILTRFGRLNHPDNSTERGAGLGLAITKTLVELHGGELAVESEEGEGARFLVRLPSDCLEATEDGTPPLRLL